MGTEDVEAQRISSGLGVHTDETELNWTEPDSAATVGGRFSYCREGER